MATEGYRANVDLIKQRIAIAAHKAGRVPEEITLVAVSKSVDIGVVKNMHQLGIEDFGENRAQELKIKMEQMPQARWHMIGRLQTNKVKDIAAQIHLIHSLDRWRLAEAINFQGRRKNIRIDTLVQVNVAGEETKTGLQINEVKDFLQEISSLENIQVLGLMTIAPIVDDPEETRPVFKELYKLQRTLLRYRWKNVDLRYLSMGMSQDFEIAIEEGANVVRIGSALFG